MSARFALKAATQHAHERLDRRIARLDLANRAEYATFLAIHEAVLPALEDQLADSGLGECVPNWAEHRRTGALRADMAAMAIESSSPNPLPPLDSTEELLGAAYVLEGSRFGGHYLARQVPDDLPAAFLRGQGNLGPWPELVAVMDARLSTAEQLDRASAAALAVFDAYARAADDHGLADHE
ncbi:MAG: biliverdin-producing heme oxygenase [Sphingomicrobium sp.]